jgi:hypothetical protein
VGNQGLLLVICCDAAESVKAADKALANIKRAHSVSLPPSLRQIIEQVFNKQALGDKLGDWEHKRELEIEWKIFRHVRNVRQGICVSWEANVNLGIDKNMNSLARHLHNLLAPHLGDVVASTTIRLQCNRMGVAPDALTGEHLAVIAERLVPAVKGLIGAINAQLLKSQILQLANREAL